MARITELVVSDVRFPTSRAPRRLRRDEPRSRLLGRLRRCCTTDDRGLAGHGHDVHHRPRQRAVLRRDRGARRRIVVGRDARRPRRPTSAAFGARSPATASCAGSARRRASSTSRRRRSSTRVWDLLRQAGPASRCGATSPTCTRRAARRRASTSATSPTRSRPTRRSSCCATAPSRARPSARRSCARRATPRTPRRPGWLGYPDDQMRRLLPGGAGRRLDGAQDEGRARPRRRPPPRARSSARQIGPDRRR